MCVHVSIGGHGGWWWLQIPWPWSYGWPEGAWLGAELTSFARSLCALNHGAESSLKICFSEKDVINTILKAVLWPPHTWLHTQLKSRQAETWMEKWQTFFTSNLLERKARGSIHRMKSYKTPQSIHRDLGHPGLGMTSKQDILTKTQSSKEDWGLERYLST